MSTGTSTILKALTLLELFTYQRASIGLSEFAKLSGYSKATTLRFLQALEAKGFVEQAEESRTYNLGPAFLRFAQLREASFPLSEDVSIVLRDLNAATGETAHASALTGEWLSSIGVVECRLANRVTIAPGEAFPFHSTASGLVYLAFAKPDVVKKALERELMQYTPQTETDAAELKARLKAIRKTGLATANGTYETGVLGIAAPYFSAGGKVCGAVAVALPTARATDDLIDTIEQEVKNASVRLTVLRGGVYPQVSSTRSPKAEAAE